MNDTMMPEGDVAPVEEIDGAMDVEEKKQEETEQEKVWPIYNLYAAAMSYNGFTITDGALRLIVLIHADDLGFTAIEIAFMFSLYELAGVFTNLFGGVAANIYGLQFTLLTSLALQIACLCALTGVNSVFGDLTEAEGQERVEATIYITAFQALAGVAKDLMKLTGKSTPKLCNKSGGEGVLFRMVAWLTGMKNALKGMGHFLGALLVWAIGYTWSLVTLIGICAVLLPVGFFCMDDDIGKDQVRKKVNWSSVFRKGHNLNVLSMARFWLFASRDIWFEIGLPLYLKGQLGWNPAFVGLFLAGYIIVYGNLQAASTNLYKKGEDGALGRPQISSVSKWAFSCSLVPLITGTLTYFISSEVGTVVVLIIGLATFAVLFAVNSAVHSYLVVSFSDKDKVAMDLGFYYMANALGRLAGTMMGGFVFFYSEEEFGLSLVLWLASPFLMTAAACGLFLDPIEAKENEKVPKASALVSESKNDDEREVAIA
ncbi:unnamed protein product [Chrysoparadoxa australica]